MEISNWNLNHGEKIRETFDKMWAIVCVLSNPWLVGMSQISVTFVEVKCGKKVKYFPQCGIWLVSYLRTTELQQQKSKMCLTVQYKI